MPFHGERYSGDIHRNMAFIPVVCKMVLERNYDCGSFIRRDLLHAFAVPSGDGVSMAAAGISSGRSRHCLFRRRTLCGILHGFMYHLPGAQTDKHRKPPDSKRKNTGEVRNV